MSMVDFPEEKTCPLCQGRFARAEKRPEYDPITVVLCPHCSKMLWRPGSDLHSRLFPFDPKSSEDTI
jgi:hypothetical protein